MQCKASFKVSDQTLQEFVLCPYRVLISTKEVSHSFSAV